MAEQKMIAVPEAKYYELRELLRMPEVKLEPTIPGENGILSPSQFVYRCS